MPNIIIFFLFILTHLCYCLFEQKEIAALREMAANLGGNEDDIMACKPRRKSKGK